MSDLDIRWQQRFSNFKRALEQQGLVKAFEYTYELAWNTMRDLLRSRGDQQQHRQSLSPELSKAAQHPGNP
ncbi:MAG: hypothetical protein EBZ24_06570 [Synechococcaceae bacterium WB9_4xB_025]|jgi:hypothetical protein|nr:hypothetical protein [Synechococcaceae bacterium WB9_4xB_025]